jgi:hypothetical protein
VPAFDPKLFGFTSAIWRIDGCEASFLFSRFGDKDFHLICCGSALAATDRTLSIKDLWLTPASCVQTTACPAMWVLKGRNGEWIR